MWKIREHWLSFTRWLNKGILLKESIAGEDRNNFKFIRLAAALLVVEGHTRRLFHREADIDSNIQFHILYLGLPTFFFLSGLLVAQSLEKSSSWKQFVWKRILRLYPAPCLSILCCACIMGPILTTLPLKSYLTSPMLYQYLAGCSIIKIFYRLPGVFDHSVNGSQGVNNSLWSLTLEWKLYAGLLIVSLIRVPYKSYFDPLFNILRLFFLPACLGPHPEAGRQSFSPVSQCVLNPLVPHRGPLPYI